MIRTDRRMRLCTAMIAAILTFIWGNSLLRGEQSQALSQWVKGLLAGVLRPGSPITGEGGLLRKIAHFTEFSALGFCLAWRCGMRGKKPIGGFLFGAAAAATDETIQRFVPGRGPSLWDVLLDCSGVLTGMLLCYLGHTILKMRKNNKHLEDKS